MTLTYQLMSWARRVGATVLVLIPFAAAQQAAVKPLVITQHLDEAVRITLNGNTPVEATAANDRGAVAADFPMKHVMLQLSRSAEQEQELLRLIDDLHDASSPNYHHWLTATEFGNRFGLAKQDLDTVTRWLESQGFKINVIYRNGTLIDFSGTAGQVGRAFGTEIHALSVNGVKHIANMSDPQIPAALAPAVKGVVSLHDFMPHPMYKLRSNYTFTTGDGTRYAVTPPDLATIYNLNPLFAEGISGQGQTIAVIGVSDVFSTDDWYSFRAAFGLDAFTEGSFTQIFPAPPSGANNCMDPGENAGEIEAIIDAEYASASAPSAAIVLAACADTGPTFGGLIAIQNLLNGNATPPGIMSLSFGTCEVTNGATANAAYSAAYQQAVAEGVSVFVSSGDEGAASCDHFAVKSTHGIGANGFASTPYNVAVGGTDFGDTFAGTNSTYWNPTNDAHFESAKSYVPEIPWNDSCASLLTALFNGFSQTFGTTGFCNSTAGVPFHTTSAGSGAPSGCATGTKVKSGVVGGTCQGWPKPSWQSLVGVPNDGVRDLPDVSLFAATGVWGHYYPFCYSGDEGTPCTDPPSTWLGGGGTSFSSPIMAGIQALVNQKTGSRQGNPNPVYYSLAAAEYGATGNSACNATFGNQVSSSCVFHDVTQGDNDIYCTGVNNCYRPNGTFGVLSTSNTAYQPAYAASSGWDFATGIGTVNAANLANNWPGAGSPNFNLSAPPVTVARQSSADSTINVIPVNGFSDSVTLSLSELPSGVTGAFNPNPVTGTSTLTLTADVTADIGTFAITVTGISGSLTSTTTFNLTVNSLPQSFTISADPNTLNLARTAGAQSTITINPVNGFSGSVSLSLSTLPKGVTASFSPNPATSASVLTLAADTTAKVGPVTLTVTGTSGNLTSTTTINVNVTALGNFSLTAAPKTVPVPRGSGGFSTITIVDKNGFNQNVTLNATGLPAGVTASFSPNPTATTSTLTFTVDESAVIGNTKITVLGTFGSLSHSTTVTIKVTGP